MLDEDIPTMLTTEESLEFHLLLLRKIAVIETKLDYIIAFVDKADKTFGEMAAIVEGNPMLKMLMG